MSAALKRKLLLPILTGVSLLILEYLIKPVVFQRKKLAQ